MGRAPRHTSGRTNRSLPPTGRVPTIGEQWAYAARRYSKYQGYAWSGVVAVAAIAYFGSLATQPTKPQQSVKTKPKAGR